MVKTYSFLGSQLTGDLKFLLVIFILNVNFSLIAFSQEPDVVNQQDEGAKIEILNDQDWELFKYEEPLRFALSFDRKLFRKNVAKGEYQPAVLSVHLSDTIIDREIRIRARGISRKVICTFPPIKINLKEADMDDTQFEHQSTLKMVTHCRGSSQYQGYIFKEYLIYKMYNLLTDYSFKVRLVQIDYIDSNQKQKPITKYGFLIEHIKDLAKRHNCIEIENEKLSQQWMNKKAMALMGVFQYMIANTDWSVTGLHNLKLLKSEDYTFPEPYPVPYDFDYAGFVDTDYAIATEGLGTESVTERVYVCKCIEEPIMYNALDQVFSKKDAIYSLINDFEYLEKKDKGFLIKYLDDFFDMMGNEKTIKRVFIDGCLK